MNSITALFDSTAAYAFAWTMIHSLWQCGLIAAALAVSFRLTRRHNASLRYLQGLFALALSVAVGAITFLRYFNDITLMEQTMAGTGVNFHVAYTGSIWEQIYMLLNSNIQYIVLFWMAGFSIQMCRYTHDFWLAFSLKKRGCRHISGEWNARFEALAGRLGITKAVYFKVSRRVTGTCLIGHFKPVVLLPVGLLTSLPPEQVEAIILHELAHAKRNDYLVNAVQCLVRLLYFFNPAVLWISSRIDAERENACDDIAVSHCRSRTLYAKSLAASSELELNLTTVMAAAGNRYQVLGRIKRLLSNSSGVSKGMEKLASAICVCLVLLTMNVGAAEYDFIQPKAETAAINDPASTAPQAETSTLSATEEKLDVETRPVKKAVTSRNTIEPGATAPAAGTVSPAEPQTPDTPGVLPASPEADYAVRSVAVNEPNTISEPAQTTGATRLARTSTDNRAQAATDRPSEPALEPVQVPDFNKLLVASSFSIPLSRKIYIKEPEAEFAEVWLERFRGNTPPHYRRLIRTQYGRALKNQLKEALDAAGWTVVNTPAADTLRLEPRLIDLYIFEPESTGIKQTIVIRAGQAGIQLTFLSPDEQPFIKIVDHRNTSKSPGSPFIANRSNNFGAFNKLMSAWADTAVEYLENVVKLVEAQKAGSV